MKLFLANLPSFAAIVGAAVCAIHGVAGWGWFLLIGLMVAITPHVKD